MDKSKVIIILTLLTILGQGLQSDCSYIKAQNRPINIAHRGLCSILP